MKNTFTALIHGASGAGKTYNALQLPGTKILLSTDGSYYLAATVAKNLDVVDVTRFTKDKAGNEKCFSEQFEDAVAKKPAHIIIDNLSDLIDAWVLELKNSHLDNGNYDFRRDYNVVYEAIRRLVRRALSCGVNVVFTSWTRVEERTQPNGEIVMHYEPQIPAKILNSVCGLCNLVGYVSTQDVNGTKTWYYDLTGSDQLLAKDQLWGRKACLPAQLFTPPAPPKPTPPKPTAQPKATATPKGGKSE